MSKIRPRLSLMQRRAWAKAHPTSAGRRLETWGTGCVTVVTICFVLMSPFEFFNVETVAVEGRFYQKS